MGVDIRFPHITGLTEKEQIKQISTYLFQLAEQLQWALNNADTTSHTVIIKEQPKMDYSSSSAASNARMLQDDSLTTFAALKPLIIKSAEIVEAYYEEINKKLKRLYVAQSDFGTFVEQTSQEIEQTSTSTTQRFENMQVIITDMDNNVGSIESSIHGIVEDLSYTQNDIIKMSVDIETIDGNITSLSGNINDLDGEIKTVAETVVGIDSELKTVGGSISTLDNTIKAVEGSVGTLDNTLKAVEGSVTNLDTGLKTIEGNVNTIDSNLKAVEGTVVSLDTNIKSVAGTVVSLDSNIKNVEGNVSTLDTNLKTVESNVSAIDSNVKTVEGNVGQLETNLQDAESGIYSNLDNLSKGVGQLDTDLQGVKSEVDSHVKLITEDINDLDNKVNDTKTNIDAELQALKKELESLNYTVIDVTANIKTGVLYYDENQIPVYGLEVGQKNVINGVEVFNKFARFTAGRLTFYDQNGSEVAYISDYKLYITHAEVTGTLKLGGYLVDTTNGLTFKWVGRG